MLQDKSAECLTGELLDTGCASIPRTEENTASVLQSITINIRTNDKIRLPQGNSVINNIINNGKELRKLELCDKLCIKFCYANDKELLEHFPHNILITYIVHKRKEISSEMLCTCVASPLFTKHHGSDIYSLYLILSDS